MLATSQSKLKSWKFCPAGWYIQYILGLDFYSPHFDLGKDYHASVENYHLNSRRAAGQQLPCNLEDIKPYTEAVAASEFLEVEKRFRTVLHHPTTGKALSLPMSGVIDRVVSENLLADYKTSASAWNQNQVDDILGEKGLQATIYCFAWWEMTGVIPDFEFDVQRKDPGPRTKAFDRYTTNRSIEDFARFHDWASAVLKEADRAMFYSCTCQYGAGHKNMGLAMII